MEPKLEKLRIGRSMLPIMAALSSILLFQPIIVFDIVKSDIFYRPMN